MQRAWMKSSHAGGGLARDHGGGRDSGRLRQTETAPGRRGRDGSGDSSFEGQLGGQMGTTTVELGIAGHWAIRADWGPVRSGYSGSTSARLSATRAARPTILTSIWASTLAGASTTLGFSLVASWALMQSRREMR